MSAEAASLFELQRLVRCGGGALSQHLLKEIAADIISEGVRDEAHISG